MEDTNKKVLPLQIAMLPLIFLVTLLSFNLYANVFIYDADPLAGSSQFILILSGAFAAMIGHRYNVSYKDVISSISNSIKSVTPALIILLWVGALAGTWMISGIIPSMVYYGLKILDPNIFLPACIVICSIISVATGSSWTTSATVGIALVGIGKALGIPAGMVGGAVIAGAYFGDKLSPLSDTTNLAAAVSKVDLFKHIKYFSEFAGLLVLGLYNITLSNRLYTNLIICTLNIEKISKILQTKLPPFFNIIKETNISEKNKENIDIERLRNIIWKDLENFKSFKVYMQTSKFNVWVDQMEDGSYRYASWSKSKTIDQKPDLILKNGEVTFEGSARNHWYTFKNVDTKYICDINVLGKTNDDAFLIVKQGEKTLLNQPAEFLSPFTKFISFL